MATTIETVMAAPEAASWQATAQPSIDALNKSIQTQWLLKPEQLPPPDRMNVTAVPEECGILTPLELEMTAQDVSGLLARYSSGEWTATAVTTAFLKRATIGQQLLNFATEFLAEDALAAAADLDEHFRKTGNPKGPLHGIPISVKEHVAIGGRICNAGFVCKVSNVATEDAHIVKLLRQAGAVIHVRTNQPQSIMHLDTNNNITGMTLNPTHLRLTPGGSSGGEGAALGFRASVLGVGTDIGGSVRAPAAFCGSYGFKPTTLRNPSLGLVGVMAGQESIRGCVGPLANSIDDVIRFEKAVWNQQPWDVETILVPLPWRDVVVEKESLVVGIMMDDGLVRPHPPLLRALREAEKQLQASGIKTVRWEPYKHDRGWEMLASLYTMDGGYRIRSALVASGEPMMPLTDYILNLRTDAERPLSVEDNWNLNFEREAYRRAYHARMKAAAVDVILCPNYAGVGALQGTPKYWGYTSIWNLLDQPALTFPSATFASKALDPVDESYSPRSELDRAEQAAYDPELFDGLNVSLQLVGKHHRDEELLGAAKLVEGALRATSRP